MIIVAVNNNSLFFFSLSLVRFPLFPDSHNNPVEKERGRRRRETPSHQPSTTATHHHHNPFQ